MTDSIKPLNAISIWANSLNLYAELPSPDGARSHLLKLPLNHEGITVLIKMLQSRRADSKIGEKGDLTRHQIKKELQAIANKAGDKVRRAKKPMPASVELRASIRQLLRDNGY